MNVTNSPAKLKKLVELMGSVTDSPETLYRCNHCDPKYDAQINLVGRTHYVDDNTLRFHKSKVLACITLYDGLLLRILTTDSLDPENRKRGYRYVTFDMFGDVVFRVDLDQAKSTAKGALALEEKFTLDLVKHYHDALKSRAHVAEGRARRMHKTCSAIAKLMKGK